MRAEGRIAVIALVFGLVAVGSLASWSQPPDVDRSNGLTSALVSSGPTVLSNGRVIATFPSTSPAFTLAAEANMTVQLTQALTGLAEISPMGQFVASAPFVGAGVHWTGKYSNSTAASTLSLSASVPVNSSSGSWGCGCGMGGGGSASLGSVNVTTVFTLNASNGPGSATVGYTLMISSWPWQRGVDSLGLEVQTNASGAPGSWIASGANSLDERSTQNSSLLARFSWGSTATAWSSSGHQSGCSVATQYNVSSNGRDSIVSLEFGSASGSYSSLRYDPWLSVAIPGVVIPPLPSYHALAAWAVGPEGLAAIAVGGTLSIALAVVAVKRRRPPTEGF